MSQTEQETVICIPNEQPAEDVYEVAGAGAGNLTVFID